MLQLFSVQKTYLKTLKSNLFLSKKCKEERFYNDRKNFLTSGYDLWPFLSLCKHSCIYELCKTKHCPIKQTASQTMQTTENQSCSNLLVHFHKSQLNFTFLLGSSCAITPIGPSTEPKSGNLCPRIFSPTFARISYSPLAGWRKINWRVLNPTTTRRMERSASTKESSIWRKRIPH